MIIFLGLLQFVLGTIWNTKRYKITGSYSKKYTAISVLGFIEFCYGLLIALITFLDKIDLRDFAL